MKLIFTLATLTALVSAAALPTNEVPYPMPTIVDDIPPVPLPSPIDDVPPVPLPSPIDEPPLAPLPTPVPLPTPIDDSLICNRMCSADEESLQCGDTWWPEKMGSCWACCTGEDEEENGY